MSRNSRPSSPSNNVAPGNLSKSRSNSPTNTTRGCISSCLRPGDRSPSPSNNAGGPSSTSALVPGPGAHSPTHSNVEPGQSSQPSLSLHIPPNQSTTPPISPPSAGQPHKYSPVKISSPIRPGSPSQPKPGSSPQLPKPASLPGSPGKTGKKTGSSLGSTSEHQINTGGGKGTGGSSTGSVNEPKLGVGASSQRPDRPVVSVPSGSSKLGQGTPHTALHTATTVPGTPSSATDSDLSRNKPVSDPFCDCGRFGV